MDIPKVNVDGTNMESRVSAGGVSGELDFFTMCVLVVDFTMFIVCWSW